jgi:hypothetical protein
VHESLTPSYCDRQQRKLGDNSTTDDDGPVLNCRDFEAPSDCEVCSSRKIYIYR